MRIPQFTIVALLGAVSGCASVSKDGSLGDGSMSNPTITAVDSARPPTSASVHLDQDAFVVLLLVAPGHSATLLYPQDSITDNRLTAGEHAITFQIPRPLVWSDSLAPGRRDRSRRQDSAAMTRGRTGGSSIPPILPNATTYLLLVTSPQRLSYSRVIGKTAGVSIPIAESEALNAVGKAIKATLESEPREWAGFYKLTELGRPR